MARLLRGRYEPIEVVGRGGQGEVLRALDHQHQRPVALKVRAAPADEDRRALLEEARILLTLTPHPGLPVVREDFFVGNRYYIVMDWVEGKSLQRLLQDQGDPGLSVSRVLRNLREVAAALDHIHRHDPPIVHRDVKPANIIVTPQDRTVLVDFGIARIGGSQTRAFGTPGYTAPEVLAGASPTPSADIYGLAATAFALLTGNPPAGELPTWEGLPASRHDAIERAVRMGLSTDPARRPASASDQVERLEAFVTEPSNPPEPVSRVPESIRVTPPARARWGGIKGRILAGTVVIALAATGVLIATKRDAPTLHPTATVSIAFPPSVYPGDLVVQRTWTLTSQTNQLTGVVNVTNASTKPITTFFDEVIPKSVASSVDALRFTPTPDRVIQRDPIVRYNVTRLAPRRSYTIHYEVISVAARGSGKSLLGSLVNDQDRALTSYIAALPSTQKPVVRHPNPASISTPRAPARPRPSPSRSTESPAHLTSAERDYSFCVSRVIENWSRMFHSANLVKVARESAARMAAAGTVSHTPNLPQAVSATGEQWVILGENVGVGPDSDSVCRRDLASDTGHQNFNDSRYNRVGIGTKEASDGRVYVTVVFEQSEGYRPSPSPSPGASGGVI